MVQIGDDVCIYDIETRTYGSPNPDKDKLKLFGCYSYKTNKFYLLSNVEDIQKVVDAHKFLVGFNTEAYDEPIIKRAGVIIDYKIRIDLFDIIKKRCGVMKVKNGILKDLLMSFSLDYITKTLELVKEDDAKIKIDYSLFQKDSWTPEELKEISTYTLRDVEVTKKLYEWIENYFEGFRDFINDDDVKKKKYLTIGVPKYAYKAICKALKWTEEYEGSGVNHDDDESISGGYVSFPSGEEFHSDDKQNIYVLDFACLPVGTIINTKTGYKDISKIKKGDKVKNEDGIQEVELINSYDYDDNLIKIELENKKIIKCTPEHQFPIYRDNKRIIVMAKDILETDELISSRNHKGDKNPMYKGKKEVQCPICNTITFKYQGSNWKGCGNKKCANKLKSINSFCFNLGKTKYDTQHLMKMSKERTGTKRILKHRYNIALETNNALQRLGSIYEYKGIYFKSEYELKVAKALDRDKIKWIYQKEPYIINNIIYTPDFYLPEIDKFLEVKGPVLIDTKSNSYYKFKEFIKKHPNSVIIQPQQIKQLKGILNGKN